MATTEVVLDDGAAAELKRLKEVEKAYKRLQLEHDLLRKAIRFCSEQRAKSSPTSKAGRTRGK